MAAQTRQYRYFGSRHDEVKHQVDLYYMAEIKDQYYGDGKPKTVSYETLWAGYVRPLFDGPNQTAEDVQILNRVETHMPTLRFPDFPGRISNFRWYHLLKNIYHNDVNPYITHPECVPHERGINTRLGRGRTQGDIDMPNTYRLDPTALAVRKQYADAYQDSGARQEHYTHYRNQNREKIRGHWRKFVIKQRILKLAKYRTIINATMATFSLMEPGELADEIFTGTRNEYLLPGTASLYNQNQDLSLLELISTDPHVSVYICLTRLGDAAKEYMRWCASYGHGRNPVFVYDDTGMPPSKRDFLSIFDIKYHTVFLTQEPQANGVYAHELEGCLADLINNYPLGRKCNRIPRNGRKYSEIEGYYQVLIVWSNRILPAVASGLLKIQPSHKGTLKTFKSRFEFPERIWKPGMPDDPLEDGDSDDGGSAYGGSAYGGSNDSGGSDHDDGSNDGGSDHDDGSDEGGRHNRGRDDSSSDDNSSDDRSGDDGSGDNGGRENRGRDNQGRDNPVRDVGNIDDGTIDDGNNEGRNENIDGGYFLDDGDDYFPEGFIVV